MASSRYLISSQTLGSVASSVTFSSIPSGYADLSLKISARASAATPYPTQVYIQANSDTGNNYSTTFLQGNGSAASSYRFSPDSAWFYLNIPQDGATVNTFSNGEIYIPSYTVSQYKPGSTFNVSENNSSIAGYAIDEAVASLYRSNSAITSLRIAGANFSSGSSFYLYGLKSS